MSGFARIFREFLPIFCEQVICRKFSSVQTNSEMSDNESAPPVIMDTDDPSNATINPAMPAPLVQDDWAKQVEAEENEEEEEFLTPDNSKKRKVRPAAPLPLNNPETATNTETQFSTETQTRTETQTATKTPEEEEEERVRLQKEQEEKAKKEEEEKARKAEEERIRKEEAEKAKKEAEEKARQIEEEKRLKAVEEDLKSYIETEDDVYAANSDLRRWIREVNSDTLAVHPMKNLKESARIHVYRNDVIPMIDQVDLYHARMSDQGHALRYIDENRGGEPERHGGPRLYTLRFQPRDSEVF